MSYIFLFTLVLAESVQATINAGPINTAVLVDDRVELACRTSQGYHFSQWLFTPVGSTSAELVYSRERDVDRKFPRVAVTLSSRGLCTLTIDNTQLMDAGIYTCKTYRSNNGGLIDLIIKESAQLIVLNDEGRCTNVSTSVAEGVMLQMRCSIHYRGYWAPSTEWREKEENTVVTDDVEAFSFANASIVSTLTLLTNSTMNGKRYIFRTFFTKYFGYSTTNATNVPGSTYSWTSPPLKVIYGPKSIRITPQLSFYQVGDRLTCVADANPAPNYEWIDHNTGFKGNGSVFIIKEGLQEQFILTCKATNAVSSVKKQINFTVERHGKSTKSSANLFLLALVPTPVLLVILAVVLFRQLCLRRDQQDPSTTNEEAHHPVAETASDDHNFDTGPESTDSYTSIPSVDHEGEVIQENSPVVMELTKAISAELLAYSVGYSQLEPREIPPPTTYSRLLKSRLEVQTNVATTAIMKKNDYVNIPTTATQSNTEEGVEGYYNADV